MNMNQALVIKNNINEENANQIRCNNCKRVGHYARNCTNRKRVRDSACYTERLMLVQQEEACIPLSVKQHDFLSYVSDEEHEEGELTTNYLFMTKLQLASPNTDTALVYDTNGFSEVSNFDHYYDNKICNLFSHEEQHHMDFGREDGEQHAINDEEIKAYFVSLFHNFNVELDKCVMVNRNDRVEITRLTTELALYKGQQKFF
ncbi:protein NRDE2 [Tanacetum coccineum]